MGIVEISDIRLKSKVKSHELFDLKSKSKSNDSEKSNITGGDNNKNNRWTQT